MKRVLSCGTLIIVALLFSLTIIGCGGGAGGGATAPRFVTYTGTNGGTTYRLEITENTARAYTPVAGDSYELTASGKESSGKVVSYTGGVFVLKPSNSEITFTVTVSGSSLTSISGTITWDTGSTGSGPGDLTPEEDDPDYTPDTWFGDDIWGIYGLAGLSLPSNTIVKYSTISSKVVEISLQKPGDSSDVDQAAFTALRNQIVSVLGDKITLNNPCTKSWLESNLIQYSHGGKEYILNVVYRNRPSSEYGYKGLYLIIQPKPAPVAWPDNSVFAHYGIGSLRSNLPSYVVLTLCEDLRNPWGTGIVDILNLEFVSIDEAVQVSLDTYLKSIHMDDIVPDYTGISWEYHYDDFDNGIQIHPEILDNNKSYSIVVYRYFDD